MKQAAHRTGRWLGLGLSLAVVLGVLALDALWLLDYLEHGQITPGLRRAPGTISGGAAMALIVLFAVLGLSLLVMVLYFSYRKLKR